jgi:hypothetical protein
MTKKILTVAAVLSGALLLLLRRADPHWEVPGPVIADLQAAPLAIPVPLVPPLPEAGNFHRWAQDYAAASSADRPAMLEQGRQLALDHRERMKVLISADPRRAMEEALPVRWRQELPTEIQHLIEQRVNARGRYAVRGVLGESPGIRCSFETADGTRYEARVYGRRVYQRTTENAAAHGVALDGIVALDDDPLRIMEPGERVQPGRNVSFTCPVS